MAASVSRTTRALSKVKKMVAESNSPTLELNRVAENYKTALKEADIETSAVANKIKEKPSSAFSEERKAARAKDAAKKAAKEAKAVNPSKTNVAKQTDNTQQVAQNQVQKNQAEVAKANEEATSQIDETAGFNKYRPFNSTIGALKDMRQDLIRVKDPNAYETYNRYGFTAKGGALAGGLFVAGAVDNTITAGIDQTSTNHMASLGTLNPIVNPVPSSSTGNTPNNAFDNMGASGDINFALRRNNTLTPGTL
nr:MAG TPA: hypothetical protein [Caudoviricetes sp.]